MGRVAARPTEHRQTHCSSGERESAFALVVLEERWEREEGGTCSLLATPKGGKGLRSCCLNNTLAAPLFLLLEALGAFRIPSSLTYINNWREVTWCSQLGCNESFK